MVKTTPAKRTSVVRILRRFECQRRRTVGYPGKDRPHQVHCVERRIIASTLVKGCDIHGVVTVV